MNRTCVNNAIIGDKMYEKKDVILILSLGNSISV